MRISNFYKQDLPLEPIVSLPRIFLDSSAIHDGKGHYTAAMTEAANSRPPETSAANPTTSPRKSRKSP